MKPEKPVEDYSTSAGTYPPEFVEEWPWFCWAYDEGRKIPRAPWADSTNGIETWVSWKDPEIWTDQETAVEWAEHIDQLSTASCLPALAPGERRPIFFDFDNVRDPETGAIHPAVWEFIVGEDRETLHAAISSSGTGIHGFCVSDRIPADKKSEFTRALGSWEFEDELDGEPEMEVYASNRFVGLTGRHIDETPIELPELTGTVVSMFDEFADPLRAGDDHEPEMDREELDDLEETTSVDDVLDAISLVRPDDIRLKSTKTDERADGSVSYDPSFANSESGTRLAAVDDGFIWREGMVGLDSLQVVAAEERILTARDLANGVYPEGEDFWAAVEELRKRGAGIPKLVDGSTWERPDVAREIEPGETPDGRSWLETVTKNAGEWVDLEKKEWTVPAGYPGSRAVVDQLQERELPADSDELASHILDAPEAVRKAVSTVRNSDRPEDDEWSVERVEPEETLDLEGIAERVGCSRSALGDESSSRIAVAFWAQLRASRELLVTTRNGEDGDETMFRYSEARGIWLEDGESRLRNLAQNVLGPHYSRAVAREIEDHARHSFHPGEPFGAKESDQFGAPEGWIPVSNGDIRYSLSGRERELHDPEPMRDGHLLTDRLPVEFDPEAECPEFEEIVKDTLVRPRTRDKFHEFAGYTLLSWGLPFHKSLFLVGPQASGKSTLIKILTKVLGERNVSNLSPQEIADEKHATYELIGKWLNAGQDIPSDEIEEVGTWKKVSAGDRMKAEQKYADPVFFEPTAKQVFAANTLPDIDVDDDAFYRRVLLVSAPNTIPPSERVPEWELFERLDGELPGVINWMLDGLDRLLENRAFTGDVAPHRTRKKWELWSSSADQFLSEACKWGNEIPSNRELSRAELFETYEEWAARKGLPAESRSELFETARGKMGVSEERTRQNGSRKRVFKGLVIDEEEFTAAEEEDSGAGSQRRL